MLMAKPPQNPPPRLSGALAPDLERAAGMIARLEFGARLPPAMPGLGLAGPPRRDPPPGSGRRPGDRPVALGGADRGGALAPRSYAGADRPRHAVRRRPACLRALPVVCRARCGAARGDRQGGGLSGDGQPGAFATDRRGPRGPRLARRRRRAAADSRGPRLILAAPRGDRPALPAA